MYFNRANIVIFPDMAKHFPNYFAFREKFLLIWYDFTPTGWFFDLLSRPEVRSLIGFCNSESGVGGAGTVPSDTSSRQINTQVSSHFSASLIRGSISGSRSPARQSSQKHL